MTEVNIPAFKRCIRCGEEKPADSFWRRSDGLRALRSWCKSCCKEYAATQDVVARQRDRCFRRVYGITLAEYDFMLTSQDGRCAICGDVPEQRLQVDHDHETGEIRGLLCGSCNAGIALLCEAPETLEAAIAYLKFHKREYLTGGCVS